MQLAPTWQPEKDSNYSPFVSCVIICVYILLNICFFIYFPFGKAGLVFFDFPL